MHSTVFSPFWGLDFDDIESDQYELSSSSLKRFKKHFHRVLRFTTSDLQIGSLIKCYRGVGLINTDTSKKCLNICFINSILQCLAYTTPFIQWLFNDDIQDKCKSSIKLDKLSE